jgi:hypothetical protein
MNELRGLEVRLSAKIEQLNHWRGDMLSQKREFDRLHVEAAHGELAEVIGVIPSDAIFSHLLDKGMISADSAIELKETFQRLKEAGKVLANAAEARDEKELIKVQIEATQDAIAELIKISRDLPIESPERIWDQRTIMALKMFGETAKAMLGESKPGESKPGEPRESTEWWKQAEPAANLLADIGGIAIPPFGVALNMERIVNRKARKKIVGRAQDSLGGAIADNWNAKVYLSLKLERVRSDIAETQRTITAYEGRKNQNNN